MEDLRVETLVYKYADNKFKEWYNRLITVDGITSNNIKINNTCYDKATAIAVGCAIAAQYKLQHQVRNEKTGEYEQILHSNSCP